jgi:hypothetical protein
LARLALAHRSSSSQTTHARTVNFAQRPRHMRNAAVTSLLSSSYAIFFSLMPEVPRIRVLRKHGRTRMNAALANHSNGHDGRSGSQALTASRRTIPIRQAKMCAAPQWLGNARKMKNLSNGASQDMRRSSMAQDRTQVQPQRLIRHVQVRDPK